MMTAMRLSNGSMVSPAPGAAGLSLVSLSALTAMSCSMYWIYGRARIASTAAAARPEVRPRHSQNGREAAKSQDEGTGRNGVSASRRRGAADCGFGQSTPGRRQNSLFYLNKLDRFPARPLDHHGACVAQPIGSLQKGDALAAQLGDPCVKISNAEPDMVIEVAARAHQRLVSLPHVPGQRHIPEGHGGGGSAERAFRLERRPGAISAAGDLAVFLAARSLTRAARYGGSAEMPLVPQLGAERIFLEHVNVVETLGREISLILDQRAVGPRHVGKARASGRPDARGAGGGDLGFGQAEDAARARPRVAADQHRASVLGGKERLQQNLSLRLVNREVLA